MKDDDTPCSQGTAPSGVSCSSGMNVAQQQPCQQAFELQDDSKAIVARACKKLNRLLLPFALVFSIIASLDRANLSFASISMSQDLGLTPLDYGLGSAIFFISYSVFQIPSNIAFIYLGGPHMLGLIAVCWGLVAGSMAAVNSRGFFLAVRFLLGVAEAGTVPGIWAYLSSMYPPDHLTLPTTFYMAGITAAQALGAPLAAGLLSLNGAANLSGWRWLFILEGAPAVLLGLAIWGFLPTEVSACSLLTPLEQQHLQAAIDGTMPPTAKDCPTGGAHAAAAAQDNSSKGKVGTPLEAAVVTLDLGDLGSSGGSNGGSNGSSGGGSVAAVADEGCEETNVLAAGFRRSRLAGEPSCRQLMGDLAAAARCRVVWCSSVWRFLYLLTLNGLIFWVPLLVHSLLGVEAAARQHHEQEHISNDTRILLLAAVPYIAGVVTHIVNALHSHRVHERRYHIAVPWAVGGVILLLLPVAWMHQADEVSYTLLVLASMGIMGCDGIDVSWIISLMSSLTPSQTALALAIINMVANFGGFVGNYVIGALKEATGNYYGAVWMMGGIMVLAAALVAAFPLSWASIGASTPTKGSKGSTDGAAAAPLQLGALFSDAAAATGSSQTCAQHGAAQHGAAHMCSSRGSGSWSGGVARPSSRSGSGQAGPVRTSWERINTATNQGGHC